METKRVGVLTLKPSLLNFDPRLNFNKTEFSTELHRTRISANDGWYFRLSITCALVLNLVLVNFITWHQKYKIKTYNVVCLKARTILVVDNNNKKKIFSCHMTTSNITNAGFIWFDHRDLKTAFSRPLMLCFPFLYSSNGHKGFVCTCQYFYRRWIHFNLLSETSLMHREVTWLIVKEAFQIPMLALNWHIFSAFSKAAKNTVI